MDPELSRRVAKIMHTEIVQELDVEERKAFVAAVDKATNFNALPSKYHMLILKAEQELKHNQKPV